MWRWPGQSESINVKRKSGSGSNTTMNEPEPFPQLHVRCSGLVWFFGLVLTDSLECVKSISFHVAFRFTFAFTLDSPRVATLSPSDAMKLHSFHYSIVILVFWQWPACCSCSRLWVYFRTDAYGPLENSHFFFQIPGKVSVRKMRERRHLIGIGTDLARISS